MAEFTMPSLGADMDEGLLVEWLVGPGDPVSKGDVVAVVETDKAAIEVECFESGTMGRLLVEPGARVPVGTPLAVIESGAAQGRRDVAEAAPVVEVAPAAPAVRTPPRDAERARPAAPAPAVAGRRPKADRKAPSVPAPPPPHRAPVPAASVPPHPEPVAGAGPLVRHLAAERGVDLASVHGTGRGGRITRADVEHSPPPSARRVRATPYARRLAHELGVDLVALHGSGVGEVVRAADVHAAARDRVSPESRPESREPVRTGSGPRARTRPAVPAHDDRKEERAAAMRRAIGESMARSKREIPHYYLSTTIDLTAAQEWLHRRNRGRPPSDRLVPAALLLKAAALAARAVPQLNGFWQDGGFSPGGGIHLGVAVSLRDGGLLTPVIHDADTLGPEELMATLKDLVQRVRLGRLRGSELSGATVTVTSLGDQGVESVFGVIHPPQVALVGFGAVVERPWATGGLLGVRPVVTATLSADHRASDGAVGARYLTAVDRLLQKPEEL
ncbi:dihydrolipoamide acetyltransferase family protein [Streptomyces sp. NPDC001260]|uniref:dihydrolipoamide acetyltransferase family protein n=1 Tax=Streptomyces sp. NPDC001260 TaxID=3364551 RepID=UPI003699CE5F